MSNVKLTRHRIPLEFAKKGGYSSYTRILPRFGEVEPVCDPGVCYTYQNVLFSLLGPVIEQTAGSAYDQLLRERIFDPLEMHSASSGMAAYLAASNRARPHVQRGKVWLATEVNENYYRVSPAAGVNASVIDLGQWLIAQMGHRPAVIDPTLPPQMTAKRIRTQRELRRRGWRDLLSDAHYGLGWRIYTVGDEEIYLHSGWVRGFVADIAYSRDRQVGLAVLLNAETRILNEITTGFWRKVLAEPVTLVRQDSTSMDAEPAMVRGGD